MKSYLLTVVYLIIIIGDISGQVIKESVYKMMKRTDYIVGIDETKHLALNDSISVDIFCVTYLRYCVAGFNETHGVSDFELYVTTLDGRMVAREDRVSGYAILNFSPKEDGGYRVILKNSAGSRPNDKIKCRLVIGAK